MRIIVYTLTRDRLEFTKHAFASLETYAGAPYEHVVVDNGSEDGTQEWLRHTWQPAAPQSRWVIELPVNRGISIGSNTALEFIASRPEAPALVIKMDNDCEVATPNLLAQLITVFQDNGEFAAKMVLSPRVDGIRNQPARSGLLGRGGLRIGLTGMIGGLFHVVPWDVYREYRYPESLPKAAGQDDHFCAWLARKGVVIGYVEDLVVRHYLSTDGQAVKFPTYFARKWIEEKEMPA